MKLAVIDCGTNTFNLLVIQTEEKGGYRRIFQSRIPVKLGEGTVTGGFISDVPFRRGIDAMEIFSDRVNELRVDKILAFATSAIRDGENGQEFVRLVKERYGIIIDVIDGEREAGLIYLGIRSAVKMGKHVSLIMDIGGGSIEFILANENRIFWKHSFNIGAARLLEKFRPSDRITAEQINGMREYLTRELQTLFEAARQFKPTELIGSSGAFESFVEMMHGAFGSEGLSTGLTEYTLPLDSYFRIADVVIGSTLAERKKIKGLVPMRIDMIVICCVMVNFILGELKLTRMRISTYSLKEGAMVEYLEKQGLLYGKDIGG
jgi:exopolyphosphatase / guanosine-5'-triphosphate,3'-diphosphate pyrophosphatase